jgi:PAS domain S-box-containing protein
MSALFEQILEFGVMSVLVSLFTWIYLHDRQRQFGFWLLSWSAIFLHFAASLVSRFITIPNSIIQWIEFATLLVAATFFMLSVSEIVRSMWQRTVFILNMGVASLVYLTGLTIGLHAPWFYVALLSTSIVTGVILSARFYGFKSTYFYAMLVLLLPYSLWTEWQAGFGRPELGLHLYLFALFCITAVAYFRRFRRLTPGVIFTSASFLAWACVFPMSALFQAHGIMHFIWDLPQYAVAFGMILTLFENQTAVAITAASRYQSLFENNLAGVYVSNFEGKLLDCNSSFWKMYGFASKEDALATPAHTVYIEPSQRASFLKDLKEHSRLLDYEYKQRKKDGSLFWVLERTQLLVDAQGHRTIQGTSIDITERKQAEESYKQSEERFHTIFDHSPIGCSILHLDGTFFDANNAMLRLLARPLGDVVGKNAVELGLWESGRERDDFYRALRAEGSVQSEVEFKDADGKARGGLHYATLVRIADKQCILGMMLELTEKRALEAKFMVAQRMEALGFLASGLAHDFNNILGVIGAYAELLDAKLDSDENWRPYRGKIVDATQRASTLTRHLLTFSRKAPTRPELIHPDDALRKLEDILKRLIPPDIELSLSLHASGNVMIDNVHFEQIILNIVNNARDAMPTGGQLFIETRDLPRPMVASDGNSSRPCVSITFRDTGCGMSEETRRRAFEPFYTTKGVGHGTGLGLSTVYGMVQGCNGEITIHSQLGKGTQICIFLPAFGEAQSVQQHSPGGAEVKKGDGNILLVEDEVELRNVNAEFLTSIGYSVNCASSGLEALKLAREGTPIDLVISDVVMPKMSAREFADSLMQVRPAVKLLFVSGYGHDVVLHAGFSENMPFLPKPFTMTELGAKVNELLAGRKRRRRYGSSGASSAG